MVPLEAQGAIAGGATVLPGLAPGCGSAGVAEEEEKVAFAWACSSKAQYILVSKRRKTTSSTRSRKRCRTRKPEGITR